MMDGMLQDHAAAGMKYLVPNGFSKGMRDEPWNLIFIISQRKGFLLCLEACYIGGLPIACFTSRAANGAGF